MNKVMIGAAMIAVANLACATAARAQGSSEASPAGGESSAAQPSGSMAAQPATGGDSGAAQAAGTPAAQPPTDGATGAPSLAPATAEAPLKTIPVPTHEPAEPLPPAPEESQKLEEVIVTAQRREERLQDVPISITVFNQEQLTKANITNSSDLATYTPSLSVNTRFGTENATFAIRGFTQDLRTTASVATYFAEVVAPRGQTSQSSGDGAGPGVFFDLENVQVLKGPQGTLFGRNTTGGAVLLVPKKPKDQFEGYLEVSGGDFSMRRAQGVLNVPLFDRFKLRFGVDHNQRDGYINNILGIGAADLANVDYTAYRLSALLNITDSLDNYTIATYTDSKTHGQTSILFACNNAASSNPAALASSPFSLLTGGGCNAQLANQAATGRNGFYDTESSIKTPITAIREKRLINTTTWHVTDDLSLKNIVAYSHLLTLNGSQIFGTHFTETAAGLAGVPLLQSVISSLPIPNLPALPVNLPVADSRREFTVGVSVLSPNEPVTSQKTWVEEVQIQGSSLNNTLKWQTGGYYEHSMPDGFSGNNSGSFLSCQLSTLEGSPAQYNCYDPLAGVLGGVLIQEYKTDYINRAVYAQSTFDIFKQLSVTGGIRYTWDNTEGYGIKTRYTFVGPLEQSNPPAIAKPKTESKAPTWLIDLSYKPNQAMMFYGKYIRGYRQGSVNLAADPGIDTFKPEKVTTYEIGSKLSFASFISGHINVAAFYNDFTDMQLQFGYISPTSGTTTAIFNAGKARIEGVEVEGFLQLFRGLSATLSYSYLKTKLLEQEDHKQAVTDAGGQFAGLTATPIADTGDSLPFAPDHTVVASLNYRLPLPQEWGSIEIGPTYVYTGKRRAAATSATPYDILKPFSLLNVNFNWISIFNLPLDFSLFATNVLDKEYESYVSGTYNVLGFETRLDGQPRMIGGRLTYRFGAMAD